MNSRKEPLVSIGLPVYNGEKYIERAIKALLCQTFENYELIISDNYSSDQTSDICQVYCRADHRIQYIRQSQNRGAVFNFQYVLDKAKGKYFMWAAHDDWWAPSFVSEMVALLEDNPTCVLAFSRMQHVDVLGNVFRDYPCITELSGVNLDSREPTVSSLKKYLLQNIVQGKVNLIYGLIRRETLNRSNVWNDWGYFGWGADLLIVLQILRYGDACINDKILFRKTEEPASEGSLKNYVKSNNPFKMIKGLFATWFSYNKYCHGIWCVLRPRPETRHISLKFRIIATYRELMRSNIAFLYQASKNLVTRLN